MKKTQPILFILFLLIIYIYVASITLLPNHIIIFEGREYKYSYTNWNKYKNK